jgi:AraC-like DNA-binding protein
MFALRSSATVCIDDRDVRLHAGEGLLVFPFQFHHYAKPEREAISWLFVTFELAEAEPLAALRYRPFALAPRLRALAAELVEAYETQRTDDLPVLLLALLLARLRRLKGPAHTAPATPPAQEQGLVLRINQIAQRSGPPPGVREIAQSLGISPSHLRARFRASCGVSIGRHLRRLRLEQACGLLRLGPQRVSEIAELCGFKSIFSFSRAFRASYGVSPLAYRHSGRAAPTARRKKSR